VGDASWEAYAANVLEKSASVEAYAKNDHLGFEIYYLWKGSRRRYIPDFIIKSASGETIVLEIKGQSSPQTDSKHAALEEWIAAVNEDKRFGLWSWAVAYHPHEVDDIVASF
jgi:type III restriction enzyme